MKSIIKLSLVLLTVMLFSCSNKKDKFFELSGQVVDTETKSILLKKLNQDFRFDSVIEIPVENGKFYYKVKLDHAEAVQLFLGEAREKDARRFMMFFLENEKIDLTIHSEEEFDKNLVKGGNLNLQYKMYLQNNDTKFKDITKPLYDSLSSLFKKDEYFSDTVKALQAELRETENQDKRIVIMKKIDDLSKTDNYFSLQAQLLFDRLDPIIVEQQKFRQDYIENNPTIVSYSFLLQDLIYKKEDLDVSLARKNYQILSQANPDHPYNELALQLLTAIETIKVGKKYIDFSVPDLNGKLIKLSNEINGKIALLDLWATWCAPCIAKSRTMIPLYNEYKDKGFTIVGVAGEFKNTDNLVRFLEKETWPWLNLVELDRQNKIWETYGVGDGGGEIFLIDKNGEILAIGPTAEEVRKILEEKLN